MEEALVARVVAAATPAGDSVSFLDRQRGDPLPAITLLTITPGEDWNHAGPTGLDEPRVRFDCYADSDEGALALKRAVRAEMRQARETGGVRFHPAELVAERWLPDGEQDGGQAVFRIQLEFQFFHEEI